MASHGNGPKVPFKSTIIDQTNLLPGILGLRGIAAISVFLYHLVHIGNISVPERFEFISQEFGKGVQLFFVLSAFSLMHSTRQKLHQSDWMAEYFVKRYGDDFIQLEGEKLFYWDGNVWNPIIARNSMLQIIGKQMFYDLCSLLNTTYSKEEDPDTFKEAMKALKKLLKE